MPTADPVAMHISDTHHSLRVPLCRGESQEEWKQTLANYYGQVKKVQRELDEIPIFYAGDVTDRWDLPPEDINFAISYMPKGWSVAGQHDLPNHSMSNIQRSAYYTLVLAGVLTHMSYGASFRSSKNLIVNGFSWGQHITPADQSQRTNKNDLMVAVVHKYVWIKGHHFQDYKYNDDEHHLNQQLKSFAGYDVVHFGDNHRGFTLSHKSPPTIFNGGTFIRRKADEKDYRPRIGILYSDGSVLEHPLSVHQDKFNNTSDLSAVKAIGLDPKELLNLLEDVADRVISFSDAVRVYFRQHPELSAAAREFVVDCLQQTHAKG